MVGKAGVAAPSKGPVVAGGSAAAAAPGGGGELAEKVGGTALATLNFEADAGKGMEEADKDSFAVPFLVMLQGLSPAVVDSLVEGAKPGLMMNSVNNALFQTARLIPVAFKRVYLRWTPRNEGGGFKGELPVSVVEQMIREGKAKEVEDDKGGKVLMDPEGCQLKDTRVHFCLQLTDAGPKPIIVSLASTQIKRSRRWMTRISDIVLKRADGSSYTPASYSHVYVAKSVKEDNEKGTWFSFDIDMEGPVADPAVYAAAQRFHEQITQGKVKVQHETAEGAEGTGSGKTF